MPPTLANGKICYPEIDYAANCPVVSEYLQAIGGQRAAALLEWYPLMSF
jgi:hypothetical protein